MHRNRTYYAGDLRTDLVQAAIDVAAESGVAQLSLRALARQLGVSHAAPKNHFTDRRALLTAVATEAHRRLLPRLQSALAEASNNDFSEQLSSVGRAYLTFARDEPGCFAVMWREDLQDRTDHALVEASTATLSVIIELSQRVARSAHVPVTVAVLMWSAVHGFADLQRYGALADLGPAADDEALLALVRTLLASA
jgi:AcrR family transcriptional regulator